MSLIFISLLKQGKNIVFIKEYCFYLKKSLLMITDTNFPKW